MGAVAAGIFVIAAIVLLSAASRGDADIKPKSTTATKTFRCPTCGAPAIVRGKRWECGDCGDCGQLK